jgi:hypothetical protein
LMQCEPSRTRCSPSSPEPGACQGQSHTPVLTELSTQRLSYRRGRGSRRRGVNVEEKHYRSR